VPLKKGTEESARHIIITETNNKTNYVTIKLTLYGSCYYHYSYSYSNHMGGIVTTTTTTTTSVTWAVLLCTTATTTTTTTNLVYEGTGLVTRRSDCPTLSAARPGRYSPPSVVAARQRLALLRVAVVVARRTAQKPLGQQKRCGWLFLLAVLVDYVPQSRRTGCGWVGSQRACRAEKGEQYRIQPPPCFAVGV
jgi:hypothetical protein